MDEQDFFFVDGKATSFADVILRYKKNGQSLFVATYGFGVKQVWRLMSNFDSVILVADESHSVLNSKAFKSAEAMSRNSNGFEFRPMRNHAKLAIIDDAVIIFTSANLSQNRKRELYFVYSADVEIAESIKAEYGEIVLDGVQDFSQFGFGDI